MEKTRYALAKMVMRVTTKTLEIRKRGQYHQQMTNPNSPFNWRTGEPSIFLKDKDKHKFNGVDSTRSTMQTRAEPRPLYLNSDSVYLQQPKLTRKAPK